MTLKDRVKALAQERGISLPALESELGFGNSKYFNVTMDYLLNGDSEEHTELNARDERDIKKDLDRIMGEIRKGDDGPLYYNGVEIDNASLSLLQNAIEYALRETKKENKVKYNPNKNKK